MASPVVAWLNDKEPDALRFLEALVNQDSGTYDALDVNRMGDLMAGGLDELGFRATRIPQTEYGDHWVWEHRGRGDRRLLAVSHIDTVFATGTAKSRPFTIDKGRAYGPGVLDMKGGITVLLFALRALKATDSPAWRSVNLAWFLNSDEEVLSPSSRVHIRAEAEKSTSVIVTEPARPGGEYVIARKGAGKFFLDVAGRAAHAGAQPELGRSAVWAMAQKTCDLHAMTDLAEGTTVNVGVIRGGTRSNVIADECYAEIDLRSWTPAAAERAMKRFEEIAAKTHVPETSARLRGDMNFPPWPEGLPGTVKLMELVQEAGRELGLSLKGIRTGGGSDGNHASAVAPTLDGFGPQGSRAHSDEEFIEVATVIERAKVTARFIELWAETFR
jgi:glutamate carboxypeptidase